MFPIKVPTDDGMCCAFNKEEADKIFVDSIYTETLKKFNENDKKAAFELRDEPSGKLVVNVSLNIKFFLLQMLNIMYDI
jgi:hypothetical protein